MLEKVDEYDEKGNYLMDSKQYKKAMEWYDKALETDTDNIILLNQKGVCLINLEQYDESLKCFNRLLEIDSKDSTAWYNKACTESLKNKTNEALKSLKKAIELNESRFKFIAKNDSDFINIKNLKEFRSLIEYKNVKPEHAKILEELEKFIEKSFPLKEEIDWETFGVKIKDNNVIGLSLYYQELSTLPESIGNLSSLNELFLYENQLTNLPDSLGNLKYLKELSLGRNKFTTLPESIGHLSSLQTLDLSYNQLTTLLESIGNLTSLQTLNLYGNQLTNLPDSIGNLKSLQELILIRNKLISLPQSIGDLTSLENLVVEDNQLTTLPESIGNLKSLKELNLNWNQFSDFPESISILKSLEGLKLYENQLTTLPESIGFLSLLQTLDLSTNQLTTLPDSIVDLKSLKELSLGSNRLKTLPDSILKLTSLQTLGLSYNQLTTLPKSMSNFKSLKELYLDGNQFTTLPVSLWRCKNLEILILRDNPWDGEWEGIDGYDNLKVLEICRQRAPVTILFSYSKDDEEKYCVFDIMENLEKRNEILKVYNNEASKILESQLFIFIATNNSISDTRCLHELGLAITHNIGIIPLKGNDIEFEELKQIDLRSEGHGYYNLKDKKGFEFDGNRDKIKEFCEALYEYIKQYKRNINLFDAEARKIDEERENVKIIFDELIESIEFRKFLENKIEQLEILSEELRTEQISLLEYFIRFNKFISSK
ncbi:MAG: leucine-rich repeat domain-containing protein [Candidatus Hermodarchaeota archaeon]